MPRSRFLLTVILVVVACGAGFPRVAFSQPQWKTIGALREGRDHFQAIAINDSEALVMGGYNRAGGSLRVLSSCEIINARTGVVRAAASMNNARAEFVALRMPDSNVMAIAGVMATGPDRVTGICEVYDIRTDRWTNRGTLITGRRQHAAVFLNDSEMVAIGGMDGTTTTVPLCEILNIRTGMARSIQPLPVPVNLAMAGLSSAGALLVVGGRAGGAGSSRSANVYRYDRAADQWRVACALSAGRQAHIMIRMSDGHLVSSGGARGETPYDFLTEVNRESGDVFTTIASMSVERVWHQMGEWSPDTLLIMGGFNNAGTVLTSCDWINVRTGSSTPAPPMLTPRNFGAALVFPSHDCLGNNAGAVALAIGGLDGGGTNIAPVEALTGVPPNVSGAATFDSLDPKGTLVIGPTSVWDTTCRALTLTNNGSGPLVLNSGALRVGTRMRVQPTSWPVILQPGHSRVFVFCFAPQDTAAAVDTFDLAGVCGSVRVPISGRVNAPPCVQRVVVDALSAQGLIDLGRVPAFDTVCTDIEVRNPEATAVRIDTAWFRGAHGFSVDVTGLPLVIAPGDSGRLTICYTPGDTLRQTDSLILAGPCTRVPVGVVAVGMLAPPQCGERLDLTSYPLSIAMPFPNPAGRACDITMTSTNGHGVPPDIHCAVYSALGVRIADGVRVAGERGGVTVYRIDAEGLTAGVYSALITAGHRMWRFPVIVMH